MSNIKMHTSTSSILGVTLLLSVGWLSATHSVDLLPGFICFFQVEYFHVSSLAWMGRSLEFQATAPSGRIRGLQRHLDLFVVCQLQVAWEDLGVQSAAVLVFSLFLSFFPFFASNMQLKSDTLWLRLDHIWSLFLPFFSNWENPSVPSNWIWLPNTQRRLVVVLAEGSWPGQHREFPEADLSTIDKNTWRRRC